MTTATHWSADLSDSSNFREAMPHTDPIYAAKDWIAQEINHDDGLDARAILAGQYVVELVGFVNAPSGPTEAERISCFDAEYWAPGQCWFIPTGETRTVEVSLAFKLVEAT